MAQPLDLIVRNGVVVTAADTRRLDVGVRDGVVVALGTNLPEAPVLDASGCYVFPGFVDPHVHLQLRVGDIVSTDDFETGTVAAACGGVTTLADFTGNARGDDLAEGVRARWAEAEGRIAVDLALHLTLTDASETTLAALPALAAAGHTSAKLYMTYAGLRLDDGEMLRALAACHAQRILPLVHAENHDAVAYLTARLLAAGHSEPRYHPASRPPLVESEAAQRALALAAMVDAPVYLAHVTCRETLAAIAQARARGQQVVAETCPQYLALSSACFDAPGFEAAKYVCTPPLRPAGHGDALWTALAEDELQIVSTDHCPWNHEVEKQRGRDAFSQIPNGLPGVETRIPLLYGLGVAQARLSLQRFVAVAASEPARALGLFPRKGTIAVGSDADLAILDPRGTTTMQAAGLHQRVDYTPFEGWTVPGRLVATVSRGEVIVREGQFLGRRGRGRLLCRQPSPWA
ncbi:MAG TPA: dihydropyrimidinase [Anaerolineae bacterium]|nr:dihydropyrimidinase [Anaerolineae bacterium]HOQ97457.1 dihydropyrimidinase [Anaerolineae bacterium]HPL30533.1 dihydropyrimidinase [Anaerolineae bacterium]